VFLAYEYPPFIFGGVGFFSKELAKTLSSQNVELTVVSFSRLKEPSSERINANLRVIRIPIINFPPRHFWWQLRNRNFIAKLIGRLSPDVIHANSTLASLPLQAVQKELDIPKIVTIHGDYNRILKIALKYSRKMLPYDFLTYVASAPLYESLLQTEMKVVDFAVAVSKHVKSDISERFKSVKITSIYNGLDVNDILSFKDKLKFKSNQTFRKSPNAKIRIAYFGRLFWVKGVTYLLRAFAYILNKFGLRNVELHVYGDGPLRSSVLKCVKGSANGGNRVFYHGVQNRLDVFREMLRSDMVVFPSLYEACPMALIEALALGRPVVVSNMPWSKEFVKHGVNGVSTNVLDSGAFAFTLAELARNKEDRERISRNATQDVKKYSILNTVSMYKDVYSQLSN
jgi:glycosyltransferase involved in cell wall biosynthesis